MNTIKISNCDISEDEFKSQVIPSLDIFKFIFSILIVMLHTSPLKSLDLYLNYAIGEYAARMAVPFFFVVSGYLCFRKTDINKFDFAIPLNYAKKILSLYLLWTLVYFIPFEQDTVAVSVRNGQGILHGILSMIRTFIFSGYYQLWYLKALFVATIIISFALKKQMKIERIMILSIILYAVGLLGQTYFFLIKPFQNVSIVWETLIFLKNIILTTRNGVFMGTLFVGIGMLYAYKKITIKFKYAVVGFVLSMMFLLAEVFLIRYFKLFYERDSYIFLVPATFFLFYIVTHLDIKQSKLTMTMRTYSMLIYLTHTWIINPMLSTICKVYEKINHVEEVEMNSMLRFSIVMIGSIIVSKLILALSKIPRFYWIKKLY